MTKLRSNGVLLILLLFASVVTIVLTIALVAARFTEDRIPRQAAPPNKGYTNEDLQGISLRDTQVRPGRLYVQLGNTVIFNNNDPVDHQVRTIPGSAEQFDSGRIAIERTYSYKPKRITGNGAPIRFQSVDDPTMRGEIIVIRGEPPLSGSDGATEDAGGFGGSGQSP